MYKLLTKKIFDPTFKRHMLWFFSNQLPEQIPLSPFIITEDEQPMIGESTEETDYLITERAI